MGESLLGYHIFIPKKEASRVIREHTKKLKAVFETTSIKFIKSLADTEHKTEEDGEEEYEKVLDALSELGVDTREWGECYGPEEAVDALKSEIQDMEEVQIEWDAPDMSCQIMKINGQEVYSLFAGGTTWGDEPDSHSYNLLKKLYNLGYCAAFEKAIKWDARPKKGKKK